MCATVSLTCSGVSVAVGHGVSKWAPSAVNCCYQIGIRIPAIPTTSGALREKCTALRVCRWKTVMSAADLAPTVFERGKARSGDDLAGLLAAVADEDGVVTPAGERSASRDPPAGGRRCTGPDGRLADRRGPVRGVGTDGPADAGFRAGLSSGGPGDRGGGAD